MAKKHEIETVVRIIIPQQIEALMFAILALQGVQLLMIGMHFYHG